MDNLQNGSCTPRIIRIFSVAFETIAFTLVGSKIPELPFFHSYERTKTGKRENIKRFLTAPLSLDAVMILIHASDGSPSISELPSSSSHTTQNFNSVYYSKTEYHPLQKTLCGKEVNKNTETRVD
jgi:hypothetical protein